MTFLYIYDSTYSNGIFRETYQVNADSKEQADWEMIHGCGDLITEHNGQGRIQPMKLITEKEA